MHLPSVLRENYENNECKTSHSNTNIPLFVMIKPVFSSLFPPGLSEVKCQPGVMTWAARAQTLSQETDNLPRAAASWAEAEPTQVGETADIEYFVNY